MILGILEILLALHLDGRAYAVPVTPTPGQLTPAAAPSAIPQPSDGDWAKILASNGFTGADLITGLEVVFAESGGNPNARNPSGARGAWQFMPDTLADDACALDPVCSTKKANDLVHGPPGVRRGWQPWSTYTGGSYLAQADRAHKAVAGVAPGCDLVWDPSCAAKLLSTATSNVSLPSLPGPQNLIQLLPPAMLAELVADAFGILLSRFEQGVMVSFEGLWGVMVAGEDNLNGQEHWGPVLVVDNTPIQRVWKLSLSIVIGSMLLLLFTLAVIYRMLRGSLVHGFQRDLLSVFAAAILASASWFFVTEVIAAGNALTNTIAAGTALELRQLPTYQALGVSNPNFTSVGQNAVGLLTDLLAILVIVVELILVFLLYFVRLMVLWALAVTAPFAMAALVLEPGRRVTYYWLELLLVTVLIKPLNALIFATFLLAGVTATGFFNALAVVCLLVFMLLIPGTLVRMFGHPVAALESATVVIRGVGGHRGIQAGARAGARWWRNSRDKAA